MIVKTSTLLTSSLLLLLMTTGCGKKQTVLSGDTGPVTAEIRTLTDGTHEILRDGKPYFIKGAGGDPARIRELKDAGGNSLRTWSTDDAENILKEAHRLDMTVMLGISLPSERNGFNYSDRAAVETLKTSVRQQVQRFKDYPALLIWGLGNELDLNYSNTEVWNVMEELAQLVKEEDPNHLVTTALAGTGQQKIQLIKERAPSLDLLAINIYGSILDLPATMQQYGWTKPYIVTEWGPTGHWETQFAPWGAPVEQTSAQKAESYLHRYEHAILADEGRLLGSYVFLWGQKQETTHTWYGLFTEAGEATEGVDVMHFNWKGSYPSNRAPQLTDLKIGTFIPGTDIRLTGGNIYSATVAASDPNGDDLTWSWEISPEGGGGVGGDFEPRPQPIPNLFINQNPGLLRFEAPASRGAYRLFVKVTDGKGKAATANIPFFVN